MNSSSGAFFVAPTRMSNDATDEQKQGGLTDRDKRANVIRLAFGGSTEKFDAFCRAVEEVVPPGTTVVLRGSAVTGHRWKDGAPFDADGPGTSDLDLTFVGHKALEFFKVTGFFVPGVHSRPMGEDDPDIAPALVPLREKLIGMVHRPVNIQASRDIVLQFRGDLLDQPYLTLLEHMRAENFIREGMEFKMDVVKTAHDVVPAFEYRLANSEQKVPLEPIRKIL